MMTTPILPAGNRMSMSATALVDMIERQKAKLGLPATCAFDTVWRISLECS
jgi:hypothetical protein